MAAQDGRGFFQKRNRAKPKRNASENRVEIDHNYAGLNCDYEPPLIPKSASREG